MLINDVHTKYLILTCSNSVEYFLETLQYLRKVKVSGKRKRKSIQKTGPSCSFGIAVKLSPGLTGFTINPQGHAAKVQQDPSYKDQRHLR